MSALRAEGYELGRLLECAGMARSSYYYALSHPARPTRPELRDAVAEIFSRTANGCGHRQVAMCLRAELGARIADKTVLKMMREMGPAAASAARPTAIGTTRTGASRASVSVNIIFTIFTNVFSPIAPTRMRRIRQRGCAAFGA